MAKDNIEELFATIEDEEILILSDLEDDDDDLMSKPTTGDVVVPTGVDDYNKLKNRPRLNGKIIENDHDAIYYGLVSTYTDNEGCTENIGSFVAGDKAENMTLQEFAYKLLHKYYEPIISISTNKNSLNKKGTIIENLIITINIEKKTNKIRLAKIYDGNELLDTYTDMVSGGVKTFRYTDSFKTNKTFKLVVNDGKKNIESTVSIKFVNPIFYGCLEDNISSVPTEDLVKNMTTRVSESKSFTYNNINMDYGRIVCAIPKSIGKLTSIKDANNVEYINSYNILDMTVEIDGINTDYYCYYLKDATGVNKFTQIYK